MDRNENYFLSSNKHLEEKLDQCIHNIEVRLDRLFERKVQPSKFLYPPNNKIQSINNVGQSYVQFKAPYIRDFRNFSGPTNNDIRQIRELTGTEDLVLLIKNKSWSRESRLQLCNTVLDYYSQLHMVELIKQKNILAKQLQGASAEQRADVEQKLSLIDEQGEQVKARKEQRIFVPESRFDPNIDWCAISAKLTNTHHEAQDCRLMWSNELHWTINDGPWTREEDVCLLNAVQKYGKNDWDNVAKELNSNRLSWQCCSRYNQEFINSYCGPTPINEDDTDKILEVVNLCRIGNYVPWNQVMYFIKYHSLHQVKYQWQKLLSERRSNQPWSHHEDVLLLKTVEKFGEKEWLRISNYIPGRSNKSCRERFIMRLKFDKRSVGNWRRKEDEYLLTLVDCFGTNWSSISSHFPERNNHQIRNRYELLKNESGKVGPVKHRKLYRNSEGFLVSIHGRRPKPSSEREVDEKLHEIFSTYHIVKSSKSIVYRSSLDELIHQNLVHVVRNTLTGRGFNQNLLSYICDRALKESFGSKHQFFPPSLPTLQGYRAWAMQQDYLSQFESESIDLTGITCTTEYHQMVKIVMKLFLWPAIVSRIQPPVLKGDSFYVGSIIEKDTKNLYKVREIQKRVVFSNNL